MLMLNRALVILVLLALSFSALSAVDKITSTTKVPLLTPSSPISDEALLDLGMITLEDGLDLTDEEDTVFPEVRYAESIYFSNQLVKTLEKSGAWGAVRVIPDKKIIMDVYVSGKIHQSDGETLHLDISVHDASGRKWFSKKYRQLVGKYAYDRRLRNLGDPFQNTFNNIANDLIAFRESLSEKQALELRTLSELKFAKAFSPAAFSNYVTENKKGLLEIKRLPAENDSILNRVQRIREKDYLYIDALQDYYDKFSQQMHLPYQDFRRESYNSVVKARQLQSQGNRRVVAGIAAIVAGIYGRLEGNDLAQDIGTVTAAAGGLIVKGGLNKKNEAASHTEAVSEMGASLESAIAPLVIELEDRTITLTGSTETQYQQWRELLQKIYQQERGDISPPS